MVTVKVFQSGNSQAVRLPKELRLEVSELQVTRRGDVLILRPVAPGMKTDCAVGMRVDRGRQRLPRSVFPSIRRTVVSGSRCGD